MKKKKINHYKCPKCRCGKRESTGNLVSYPDHYERFNCAHCGFLVGMIDNSPYRSCWDFKSNGYVIEI